MSALLGWLLRWWRGDLYVSTAYLEHMPAQQEAEPAPRRRRPGPAGVAPRRALWRTWHDLQGGAQ